MTPKRIDCLGVIFYYPTVDGRPEKPIIPVKNGPLIAYNQIFLISFG